MAIIAISEGEKTTFFPEPVGLWEAGDTSLPGFRAAARADERAVAGRSALSSIWAIGQAERKREMNIRANRGRRAVGRSSLRQLSICPVIRFPDAGAPPAPQSAAGCSQEWLCHGRSLVKGQFAHVAGHCRAARGCRRPQSLPLLRAGPPSGGGVYWTAGFSSENPIG